MDKRRILVIKFVLFLCLVSSIVAGTFAGFLSNTISAKVSILPDSEINVPDSIDDCKDKGYLDYTTLDGSEFKNQGECVSYVATSMCKDESWKNLKKDEGSEFKNQGDCVSYFKSAHKPLFEIMVASGSRKNVSDQTEANVTRLNESINQQENFTNSSSLTENAVRDIIDDSTDNVSDDASAGPVEDSNGEKVDDLSENSSSSTGSADGTDGLNNTDD
ncbi:MAG: hypothetical protein ACLFP2_05380 [Candidatus Woesearchaeota archaeon]